MPRKSTRHADEHRITLGDFERSELRKVVRFQQYGPLLQGAGFATLGLAGLLGAVVFMRYKAPDIPQAAKNALQVAVNRVDTFADSFATGDRAPIEHRRQAQAFAKRRNKLAEDIDYRCTHSSEGYDETECSILHTQTKRDYFDELQAFNDMTEKIGISYSCIGKTGGDVLSINSLYRNMDKVKEVYFNRFKEVIEQDL